MAELVLKEEVYEVIGAAMEVYYQLGRGFLEPIYQEALEIELSRRGLPFEPQAQLTIEYKGLPLEKKYVAYVVCFNQIVVELKACDRLTGIDEAQLFNYMRITRLRVGLLINFGSQVRLVEKVRNLIRESISGNDAVRVNSCDLVDRLVSRRQHTIHKTTRTNTNRNITYGYCAWAEVDSFKREGS